jgi:tetratricopeptide (TPR) repeat protein
LFLSLIFGVLDVFMAGKRALATIEQVASRQDVINARAHDSTARAAPRHRWKWKWKWKTTVALVSVAAVAGVYLGYREYQVSRLARSVRQQFAERRFAAAREPLARWLAARPSSGEAQYYRGWSALVGDDPPEAIAAIERSRRLGYDPERLDCLTAIYHSRASRYGLAEPALEAAYHRGTPPQALVARELARIYLSTYRLIQANEVIEVWKGLDRDDPEPYLWANEIATRSAVDPTVLIQNYRAALDRDPQSAKARLGLAQQLSKVRRFDEAEQAYRGYLDLNPRDAAAYVGLGRDAFQQADIDKAASLFEKALELSPRDAIALRELAQIELRRGRFPKARERLELLTQIEPFDPDAHYALARVLRVLGDEKRARAKDERAAVLRKEEAEILKLRERLLNKPGDLATRFEVAKWMLLHGHDDEGIKWTAEIIRADPRHAPTHQMLAEYFQKQGNSGLANYHRLMAAGGQ